MSKGIEALNRLCKWRSVFVGWMLGTKWVREPGVKGYRDQVDKVLILRAEVNALTALLIDKGVITAAQFDFQLVEECNALQRSYEASFPGFRATDAGLIMEPEAAVETMKRLGFPA